MTGKIASNIRNEETRVRFFTCLLRSYLPTRHVAHVHIPSYALPQAKKPKQIILRTEAEMYLFLFVVYEYGLEESYPTIEGLAICPVCCILTG